MEFKEFEEKAKKYFEKHKGQGVDYSRVKNIICEDIGCNDCVFNMCNVKNKNLADFKALYTDENVARLEKYLEDKKMGNFKVRCVNTGGHSWYTKDKIYEVNDGKITSDTGGGFRNIKNFTDLCECSSATWELVEGATDTNVENTAISPNETICKLESEIAELKERLQDKEYEITALVDVNKEYQKENEQLKSQLPKEKTIKDELDEIERDLLKVQQAVEMKEASYNQGYKQGIEDMHKHLRQTLKLKGIE